MIKYNNSNINDWNYGASNIIKVYRNNAVCYYKITGGGDTPTSFKYRLTLSNTSVVSAECDASSAITSAETSAYTGSVVSAEIGNCVTSIGDRVFYNCRSLTSIDIPDSVTSIGNRVFYNCSRLTSIDIPSGVTSIGSSVFYNCSGLTSIVIPNSVTSIGGNAFNKCTSLTSCTIGSGVTTIGIMAFNGCSGLTSIAVNATTPPTLGNDVFKNTNNCPIYVPSGSVTAYQTAWSTYADRIQAIPNS